MTMMAASNLASLSNNFLSVSVNSSKKDSSTGNFEKTIENVTRVKQNEMNFDTETNAKINEKTTVAEGKEKEVKTPDKDVVRTDEERLKEAEKALDEINSQKSAKTKEKTLSNTSLTKVSEDGTVQISDEMAQTVLDAVAQTLDISLEDLTTVMEDEGLAVTDLFSQDGLQTLTKAINNITDSYELLTNEVATTQLGKLINLMETVKETGEIPENFKQVLTDIAEISKDLEVQTEITEGETEVKSEVLDEEVVSVSESKTVSEENLKSQQIDYRRVIELVNHEVSEQRHQTNVTDNRGFENESLGSDRREKNDFEQNTEDTLAAGAGQFTGVTQAEVNNGLTEVVSERFGVSDSQEIMRQIVDEVRASAHDGVTSLEVALTPETLGKVNIQVIAKDGAVTAQIATETETARNAVESQMMRLRETLEEQGIKVDNVEVVISGHAFDSNSENDSNNQDNGRRKLRKNINFSDIDTEGYLDEDESQDELLMSGSTVSYLA